MSVMERRLQLLLDQERYDRVAAEAASRGASVASVIREAIDVAFPAADAERWRVLGELLDETAVAGAEEPTWDSTRALMEADLAERFS